MTDWLSTEEALTRLRVRPQTLYAYVSRGRLRAEPDPIEPRRSRYRASDVAALAERKARGRKAADVAFDIPAFVKNSTWDVIAFNATANALFGYQHTGDEDDAPDGHADSRERHGSMLLAQMLNSRARTNMPGCSDTISLVRSLRRRALGYPRFRPRKEHE